MTNSKFPVSVLVEKQLPSWVHVDYPKFTAFIEAYYEWMEQQGQSYWSKFNLTQNQDVDKTIDEFLKFFRKEYLVHVPESLYKIDECKTQNFTVGNSETFILNLENVTYANVTLSTSLSPHNHQLGYSKIEVKYKPVVGSQVTLVGGTDFTFDYSNNKINLLTGSQITTLSEKDEVSIKVVSYKYTLTNPITSNTEIDVVYDGLDVARENITIESYTINNTIISNGYIQLVKELNDWSSVSLKTGTTILESGVDYTIDTPNKRLYLSLTPILGQVATATISSPNYHVSAEKSYCGDNEREIEFNPANIGLSLTKVINVQSCDNLEVNERLLIKTIKKFNVSRGTEASYRLLFRLLFNEDIEIFYPSKNLLIPSDGKWSKNQTLTENFKSVTGTETYIQYPYNITNSSQITSVSSNIKGELVLGTDYSVNTTLDRITLLVSAKYPLAQLTVGEVITTTLEGISTIAGSLVEVYKTAVIPASPTVHLYDTTLKFDPNTIVYELWLDNTTQLVKNNQYSLAEIFDGNGSHIRISVDTSVDLNPVTNLVLKYIEKKVEGKFLNEDGKLSSIMVLQDSLKYQKFSYVIKSEHTTDQYGEILKRLIHPAGLIMFGQITLKNCIHLNTIANFDIHVKREVAIESNNVSLFNITPKLGSTIQSWEQTKFFNGLSAKVKIVGSMYVVATTTDETNNYIDLPFDIDDSCYFYIERVDDHILVFPYEYTVDYDLNRIYFFTSGNITAGDNIIIDVYSEENNTQIQNQDFNLPLIHETVVVNGTDLTNGYVQFNNNFILSDTIGLKINKLVASNTNYTIDYTNNRINILNNSFPNTWLYSGDSLSVHIHRNMTIETVNAFPSLGIDYGQDTRVDDFTTAEQSYFVHVDSSYSVDTQFHVGNIVRIYSKIKTDFNYIINKHHETLQKLPSHYEEETHVVSPTDITNGYIQLGNPVSPTDDYIILNPFFNQEYATDIVTTASYDIPNNLFILDSGWISGHSVTIFQTKYIQLPVSFVYYYDPMIPTNNPLYIEITQTREGKFYNRKMEYTASKKDFEIDIFNSIVDFTQQTPYEYTLTSTDISNGYVQIPDDIIVGDLNIIVKQNNAVMIATTDYTVNDIDDRINLVGGSWSAGQNFKLYYSRIKDGDDITLSLYGNISNFSNGCYTDIYWEATIQDIQGTILKLVNLTPKYSNNVYGQLDLFISYAPPQDGDIVVSDDGVNFTAGKISHK